MARTMVSVSIGVEIINRLTVQLRGIQPAPDERPERLPAIAQFVPG